MDGLCAALSRHGANCVILIHTPEWLLSPFLCLPVPQVSIFHHDSMLIYPNSLLKYREKVRYRLTSCLPRKLCSLSQYLFFRRLPTSRFRIDTETRGILTDSALWRSTAFPCSRVHSDDNGRSIICKFRVLINGFLCAP